jgi:hypothetical protein
VAELADNHPNHRASGVDTVRAVAFVALEPLLDGDLRVPRRDMGNLPDFRRLAIEPVLRLRFDRKLLRMLAAVAFDIPSPPPRPDRAKRSGR